MQRFFSRFRSWFVAAVIVSAAGWFFSSRLISIYVAKVESVDERLPLVFRAAAAVFWLWVIGLAAAAIAAVWRVVARVRRLKRAAGPGGDVAAGLDPAAVEALTDVLDLTRRNPASCVYLTIGTSVDRTVALLEASGLRPLDTAPEVSTAPIQGFLTAEGVFVWCSVTGGKTASIVGHVGRALEEIGPTASPLRGIILLLTAEELENDSNSALAFGLNSGLRALAKDFPTRCPVYSIVTGMEAVPGFLEFARRMPPDLRSRGRCGFTMAEGSSPSYDRLAAEFDRFLEWYNVCLLDLFAIDPLAQTGNEGLYGLSRWLIGTKKRLLTLLEAVGEAGGEDPIDLIGCYFTATGPEPDRYAYAAGVVRGRVAGDPNSARWSGARLGSDAADRRAAVRLGIVGLTVLLPVWGSIIWGIGSLWPYDRVGLTLMAFGWVFTCYSLLRDKKQA